MKLIRRADHHLEQWIAAAHATTVGKAVEVVAGVAIFLIPILGEFNVIEDFRWAWGTAVAGLVFAAFRRYAGGAPLTRLLRKIAGVNGSFAGSIDVFGQKLHTGRQRRLTDQQCEHLCTGLLHRVRDFAAVVYETGDRPRLRATLAVPVGDPVEALRIWCYDETHGDRGFTRLPLYVNGAMAPGAPAAYLAGEAQIIADITDVPGPATARALPYRSVLSIPTAARGPNGRPLAVVNIDADVENFFELKAVVLKVMPLVSPLVSMLGLVLLSRRQGAPYEFPN